MKSACQFNGTADVKITHVRMLDDQGGQVASDDDSLLIKDNRIVWRGCGSALTGVSARQHVDGQGMWLLPGWIDSHTHLVFGGHRANEFEQRLRGVSYQQIAASGGGIQATVTATREASDSELLASALRRAASMLAKGVTSIEIKSGYGLTLQDELRMLRIARQVGEQLPIRVFTTFLGAHALPPEYRGDAQGYIDLVCEQMIPAVAREGLADAVDVFCEQVGFSLAHTRQVFEAARSAGLSCKLHAEQLSDSGGSQLAAEFGAASVDHIEYLSEQGVQAIAASGTVATLLPGAFYFLRETQKPPVDLLRAYRVPMAVASDFNPGTSPISDPAMIMNMASTLFGLTVDEALKGMTCHAASALKQSALGKLEPGCMADMVLWDVPTPAHLVYEVGINRPTTIWIGGNEIHV